MKLYLIPGTCSTADDIVLAWCGAGHEVEIVKDKQDPEYLKMNPSGVVPTLVDGDFVLTQNAAIMGYIADRFPGAGLYGDGSPRDRAEANRWLAYVNADLHPAFKPIFAPANYLTDESQHDALKQRARERVAEVLRIADDRLDGRDWLPGFRSGADAYFYVTLRWALAQKIDFGALANVAAFAARFESDETVAAVIDGEGLELAFTS